MITIIYVYNGQDDRLSCIKRHLRDDTQVVILNNCGEIGKVKAINQAVAILKDWLLLADIERVMDRDRVDELNSLKLEIGNVYLCDKGNAFLIHKDDLDKIGGYVEPFIDNLKDLKTVETNILFDLWDSIPYETRTDKQAINPYLNKAEAMGINVIKVT